jgi:predicted nucleotidyltransferase
MGGLVSVPRERVKALVLTVLQKHEEIAGAYHFGSSLTLCRPDSDIDLALVVSASLPTPIQEGILESVIDDLRPYNGHAFDVVLLNSLPSMIAFRVIKEGYLIYCSDGEAVADLVERISQRYREDYPRYRAALKDILGV